METENSSINQPESREKISPPRPHYPGNMTQDKSIVKMGLITLIALILLIPTFLIGDLIKERWQRKNEITKEMEKNWGGEQILGGMVFQVPYTVKKGKEIINDYVYLKPERMDVKSTVLPYPKHISIFEIMTYNAHVQMDCDFESMAQKLIQEMPDESIHWESAVLLIGISDIKGLSQEKGVTINGQHYPLNTDVSEDEYFEHGLSCKFPLTEAMRSNKVNVKMVFEVRGTQKLMVTPTGKFTDVWIKGATDQVSFRGDYLTAHNTINDKKFEADWKILPHNRTYRSIAFAKPQTNNELLGVTILDGIDGYDKTERSIKYAILVIGLTLIAFFFIELLNKKRIHPVQYGLVGISLCVYYILLLSLSEYITFNIAYTIATFATIALIVVYTKAMLKDNRLALAIAATLSAIYVNIFILISMEDYALLCGSIGLFIVVAILMYFSKRLQTTETESIQGI